LSQKIKRGEHENVINGKSNGGTLPLGIKIENGRYAVNKEEAKIVRSYYYSRRKTCKKRQ